MTWHWPWWVWPLLALCKGAVIAPRWVNTNVNPCSDKSWQLLYWPIDGSCHRIFTQGPCAPTQEFYYDGTLGFGACRCPRATSLYKPTGLCYPEYTRGPCAPREYLQTDAVNGTATCQSYLSCPPRHVFWPRTDTCYEFHTRGPCLNGNLIFVNPITGDPDCGCDRKLMAPNYWSLTGLCFEMFTRGPCQEGKIFLYNVTAGATECACSPAIITNYHPDSGGCHELNTQGPCPPGQLFSFDPNAMATKCQCRGDFALWPATGHCYRLYSRGPCEKGEFFAPNSRISGNVAMCRQFPCLGTNRYYPSTNTCYRLGLRGPCPDGQLFIYDETSPLRGTCGCSAELIGYWASDKKCYELSQRGPCAENEVLSYEKATGNVSCLCDAKKGFLRMRDNHCHNFQSKGVCPAGHTPVLRRSQNGITSCVPTQILANFVLTTNSTLADSTSLTDGENNSIMSDGAGKLLFAASDDDTQIPLVSPDQVRHTAHHSPIDGREIDDMLSTGSEQTASTIPFGSRIPRRLSLLDREPSYEVQGHQRTPKDSLLAPLFTGRTDGMLSSEPWWGGGVTSSRSATSVSASISASRKRRLTDE